MIRPLQYAIYKGKGGKNGAAQFNFQPPHFYKPTDKSVKDFTGEQALDDRGYLKKDEGWKIREGAVFLELSNAKGKNDYDWENAMKIALSTADMGTVLNALETGSEVKIVHDPNAGTPQAGSVMKGITVNSPKGLETGCMINARMKAGSTDNRYTIPLSPGEVETLKVLFRVAIVKSLAWEK